MAPTVAEVPQAKPVSEHGTFLELHDRLDALWTQYLQLLDDYTTAQASIQKHLAAGFFSLTQANFQSSGRRYGRDYYDDRTVATVRTKASDGGLEILKINLSGRDEGKEATSMKAADEPDQLPSPSPTPEPEEKVTSDGTAGNATTTERPDEKASPMIDPIRWFGILTPSSLRSAQQSFTSTLLEQDVTAKAVGAARGLRDVEAEIRKLRKVIKKLEKAATAS